MRRVLLSCVAALLMAGAASSAMADEPGQSGLRVIAFNVLAPIWAAPVWYPDSMDAALLDATFRRERIVAFLRDASRNADVVCLQEVQIDELPYFEAALGSEFQGQLAVNDRAYWSSWLTDALPWRPNGPAIFVRTSAVSQSRFADLALSDSGNHAAMLEGIHASSGKQVRAVSVHLDSDVNSNRVKELRSLMEQMPSNEDAVDIVCGDFNEDTVTGSAAGILKNNGYADVLASVGNRDATHPFTSGYNKSARWAIIDHVVVRGATPAAGGVFDFGVWSIADEVERIEENFRRSGSDHFPIRAELRL